MVLDAFPPFHNKINKYHITILRSMPQCPKYQPVIISEIDSKDEQEKRKVDRKMNI